jgi:hypothetical protein
VISERTGAELAADIGATNFWTLVGSNIYRNSNVAIGRITIPSATTFSVQNTLTDVNSSVFSLFRNATNGGERIAAFIESGQIRLGISADTNLVSGFNYRGLAADVTRIFRILNSSNQELIDVFGNGQVNTRDGRWNLGTFATPANGLTVRGTVATSATIFRLANSSNVVVFDVGGNGQITVFDSGNIVLGTTTGTRIGTATNQRLAFYNSTPIVQPSGDILTALSNLGLVASPTITPVDQFTAKTTASADQTLPSGVLTILDYDTTVVNNNTSIYTVGTTGRITVNSTGIYTITAGVVVEADAITALESAFLGIFRNGDLVAISSINTTIAAGAQSGLSTSTILSLTSGDIIDCRALVNSVGGVANGLARRLGTLLGANATQVNSLSITKSSQ